MTIHWDLVFDAQDQNGKVHRVRGLLDDAELLARKEQTQELPYRYIIQMRVGEKPLRFVKPGTYETLDGAIVLTSDFFE